MGVTPPPRAVVHAHSGGTGSRAPLPFGKPLPLSLSFLITRLCQVPLPARCCPRAGTGGSEQAGSGAGAAARFCGSLAENLFFLFKSAFSIAAACPVCCWRPPKHGELPAPGPRRFPRRAGGSERASGDEWASSGCRTALASAHDLLGGRKGWFGFFSTGWFSF